MKTDFDRELDDIFANVDEHDEAEARLALDIASQFTALRLRRGLSQAQVAEKLGKTQQAISKIENPGHNGHQLARLKEAVEALDATLDVTLVPREDAEAYRASFVPKPALEPTGAESLPSTRNGLAHPNPEGRPVGSTTKPSAAKNLAATPRGV